MKILQEHINLMRRFQTLLRAYPSCRRRKLNKYIVLICTSNVVGENAREKKNYSVTMQQQSIYPRLESSDSYSGLTGGRSSNSLILPLRVSLMAQSLLLSDLEYMHHKNIVPLSFSFLGPWETFSTCWHFIIFQVSSPTGLVCMQCLESSIQQHCLETQYIGASQQMSCKMIVWVCHGAAFVVRGGCYAVKYVGLL